MRWEVGVLSDYVSEFIVPQRDKPKEFEGLIPWCRIEDFDGRYLTDSKSGRAVTEEQINSMPLRVFPKGCVAVSCSADLGRAAICRRPLVTNQTFIGMVCGPRLNPEFLQYAMTLRAKELNQLATGATIKYLSKKKFQSLPFALPIKEEQERIVEILDQAFEAIDKAKANIERNLANARELFQSRLNEIFSNPPADWEVASLGEACSFIDYRGRTPNKTDSGIRLITAKNIRMGYVKSNPQEFIASSDYEIWMTRGIPKKGDVLFTTEAPLANVATFNFSERIALAQRIITLSPKVDLRGEFLCFHLQSRHSQNEILGHATGATVSGIKSRLLKSIRISFPTIAFQNSIVDHLTHLENETFRLESLYTTELNNLEELRQSILEQAFEGKLTEPITP